MNPSSGQALKGMSLANQREVGCPFSSSKLPTWLMTSASGFAIRVASNKDAAEDEVNCSTQGCQGSRYRLLHTMRF